MVRYCKWIHPQIPAGKSFRHPLVPEAFIRRVEITVTLAYDSADEKDRAEFWEYDADHPHADEVEEFYTTYDSMDDYQLECYDGLTRAAYSALYEQPE